MNKDSADKQLNKCEDAHVVSGESGKVFKKLIRFIFGISLSVICIYYLYHSIEKDEVLDKFRNADISYLGYALFCTFLSYGLRTFRWKYFFSGDQFTLPVLYRSLILGFFMNNVLPARIGELVRCHSLGRRTGTSRSFVLATVAVERLADGLAISAIFGLFFYFSTMSRSDTYYISLVAYMFLCASISVVLFLVLRHKFFRLLHGIERRVPVKSFSYFISKVEKFVSGLEPLLEARLLYKLVFFSALVWGVELFAYYLITLSFTEHLDLARLSLFLASVNFASLIPAAPGGVGVIENFASLALNKGGVNHEAAVAMVIAQHAIQYIAVGIPGIYYAMKDNKDTKVM